MGIYLLGRFSMGTLRCKLNYNTGSCNNNQRVMGKMTSSYCIILTNEERNLDIYGMESPSHIHNHTAISFSFWRFVDTDFKIIVWLLSIQSNYLII